MKKKTAWARKCLTINNGVYNKVIRNNTKTWKLLLNFILISTLLVIFLLYFFFIPLSLNKETFD